MIFPALLAVHVRVNGDEVGYDSFGLDILEQPEVPPVTGISHIICRPKARWTREGQGADLHVQVRWPQGADLVKGIHESSIVRIGFTAGVVVLDKHGMPAPRAVVVVGHRTACTRPTTVDPLFVTKLEVQRAGIARNTSRSLVGPVGHSAPAG